MPIYEYRCEKCGDFETSQRITDDPLQRCPTCRRKVRRLISSTSFQLKGSGWYITDYARSGSGAGADKGSSANGSGSASESTSDTKGDTTTDTKTETKTDGKPSSGEKAGKPSGEKAKASA
jgi:putative FmdB family regulatory protein